MELLGKSKEELRAFCVALGEPAFRGAQIYHALYSERKFDVAQITNLPSALRERLSKEARITLPEVKQRFASTDGSVRYLFDLPPSEEKLVRPASVEAVFMPSEGRQTICVSTQAGCAVDCHFCMTAQLGLIRNLTSGEILAQVLVPLEEHKAQLAPQTNIVLMGQGEPLLNFEPVMVGGVNDAVEDARLVVRLLTPLKRVKVNLIPWNPGELPYRESSPERIEQFRQILVGRGVPTFVRYSRGRDVMAACGQLALLQ